MALSIYSVRHLIRMFRGETVAMSCIHPNLLRPLIEAGAITRVRKGSGYACKMIDEQACRTYFAQRYGIHDLEGWLEANTTKMSRSEQVALAGDSKLCHVRTFRGFLIKSPKPLKCTFNGQKFILHTRPGMSMFIEDIDRFSLPSGVTVVGMENGENFQQAERQLYLFGRNDVVFVSRYPQSADLVNWLLHQPVRYIHFGDFDLAGINIFLTEFYSRLGEKSEFFIPEDIEQRIRTGNANLYNAQYQRYKDMVVTDSRLQPLVNMLHRYERCYEQEGYISPATEE